MTIEAVGYHTMEDIILTGSFIASGQEVVLAFAKTLGAVQNIAKTQTADTGKYTYRYADLGDVIDEVKRACQMFGLAVFQMPGTDEDKMTVTTGLIHENGEWLTFPPMGLKLPNDAQAVGSALTYARRYSLLTIFGIAPEDDDGRAATQAVRAPAQNQGYRTPAEQMVHAEMAMLDGETAKRLREDFRHSFGMGLSDMQPNRHGDALTFVRAWLDQEAERLQTEGLTAPAVDPALPPEEPY